MNKKLFSLLCLLPAWLAAQVSVTPVNFKESDSIEILFDATQGSKGMMGATECYAHTGLITSSSTGLVDWKYAPTWGDNAPKYKMELVGTNKWKLSISPTIRDYYGVTTTTEKVKQLSFVFRNADGSKQGKGENNEDLFVRIPQHIEFLSPASATVTSPSSPLAIRIAASEPSELSLFMNDVNSTPIVSVTEQTELSIDKTFPKGDYHLIAQAVKGGQVYRDTTYICSFVAPVSRKTRPEGVTEGVTVHANGDVTFCIFAPRPISSMFLLGEFNDFLPTTSYVMNYDYVGNATTQRYYWLTLSGLDPNREYAYQYLADREIRVADPYSTKILDPWNDKYINEKLTVYPNLKSYPIGQAQDPVSVFQINKPSYQWQANNFVAPKEADLIIYELLFRDFTTEGTVRAAMAKLDYLKTLGVNAIELMPIQEFDGNDSWGYNPNFYFAADKAYGTENDYKLFIDECHKRGMAVILDVVFNHSWGQHPWCKLYWDKTNNRPASTNPFYNEMAPHPYSVGNDFKHSNPNVRSYFKNVLSFWLTEYKLDGYRFDLSKGLTDNPSNEGTASNYDALRIQYLKEYNEAIKAVNPTAYTILEHFCAEEEERVLSSYGMMVWRNINHAYCQAAMGVADESNFVRLWADGSSMPASSLVGYMESHDEERTSFKAKTHGIPSIKNTLSERMKQAANNAAFFLTVPGAKMIWQFGELGYDVSIEENGRTGRKPILWNYYDEAERQELYQTYSKVTALRHSYPDLFSATADFAWKVTASDWEGGRFIRLTSAGKSLVVAGNFDAVSQTLSVDFPKTGTWYNYMDDSTLEVTSTTMSVAVPAHEFRLFTDFLPVITNLDKPVSMADRFAVYPNPTTDMLTVNVKEVIKLTVYTLSGIQVKEQVDSNQMDVSELQPNTYLLRVTTAEECQTQKFIKM